jgi:hypothetical protein
MNNWLKPGQKDKNSWLKPGKKTRITDINQEKRQE